MVSVLPEECVIHSGVLIQKAACGCLLFLVERLHLAIHDRNIEKKSISRPLEAIAGGGAEKVSLTKVFVGIYV
jgi:hypothetical protein